MKLAWALALMLSAAPALAAERLRIAVLGVRASDREAALRAEARLLDGLRAGGAEVAASESISHLLGYLRVETLTHCVIVQDGTCALSPVLEGVDVIIVAELRHYDERLRLHIASADGQRLRQDEFEGDSFPALLAMLRTKGTRLARELRGLEVEEEVSPDDARLAARMQGPPGEAGVTAAPVSPDGRTQVLASTLPAARTTVLAAAPPAPPAAPEATPAVEAAPAVVPAAAASPPAPVAASAPPTAVEVKPAPKESTPPPPVRPAPKPAPVVAAAPRKPARVAPAPPPPKPAVKPAPTTPKTPRGAAGADSQPPAPVVRPAESKYRVVRPRIPGGPWPVLATGIGLTGLSGIFAANAATSARVLESPGDSGPRSPRHAAELRDALGRDTTVAIVLGIAGAAGITTGIVLLAITPGSVRMTVTPTGTGLNLSGTF